ncbi:MAG: hypothetical protein ACRC2T_03020 [Thermoguttaceae bacterium]
MKQIRDIICVVVFVMFLTSSAGGADFAVQGLTPQSPQVQASVARAVSYLEKNGAQENRTGGKALIGLALIKAGVRHDHPLVVAAVGDIRQKLNTPGMAFTSPIYDIGISAMFLCELDPVLYRAELIRLSELIHFTQQTQGGWGYLSNGAPTGNRGDMSMTQYAVMGAWTLHTNGIPISEQMMGDAAKWLLYVQAENGGFAYTSSIGNNGQVTRDTIRNSTTAAGMASVYLMREIFGLNVTASKRKKQGDEEFVPPRAFRKIQQPGAVAPDKFDMKKYGLNAKDFEVMQNRGDWWFQNNFIPINPKGQYFFYYLYAFERYKSFQEVSEGISEASPFWYNAVVECALNIQEADGSWNAGIGKHVDTAYGILVLLRSTKQTLGKAALRHAGGNMQGGRGLPKSTDQLEIRNGQVVSLSELVSVDAMMEKLDELQDFDDNEIDRISNFTKEEANRVFENKRGKITSGLQSGSPQTRHAIVQLIKKSGDVNSTPQLIYALSDPDATVAQAAQDALLSIYREPKGKRLPAKSDPEYEKVRTEQIQKWKNTEMF